MLGPKPRLIVRRIEIIGRTRVRRPKTNGFVERFNGTVLDEFFRVKMRENFYECVETLQADLDAWLHVRRARAVACRQPASG